ncbi:MAG: histone deacetylase family protein [Thermoprotei archaeon]
MPEVPVIYGPIYEEHRAPGHHPENPDRVRLVLEALRPKNVVEPQPVRKEDVLLVHDPDYVELVEKESRFEYSHLDPDTYVNDKTFTAALYALGGALLAYELQGFALVRPPGHHSGVAGKALGGPTLGFCIFNNVAFPVRKLNLKRVAIIDFDVHHGNGTQEIFWNDPNVLHIDVHQDPRTLYPGTGFPEDVGGKGAEGTKVNLVLPPGAGDDAYLELFPIIESILDDFKPEVIAFSAGFDAFEGDGLARVRATELTFYNFGKLARKAKRFYAVLEGGYSVGLKRGTKAFYDALNGVEIEYKVNESPVGLMTSFRDLVAYEKRILRNYWKV